MHKYNVLKLLALTLITSTLLISCGGEVKEDTVQGLSSSSSVVNSTDSTDDIHTDENLVYGIYKLYPVGNMVGKTKQELVNEYDVNSSDPDVEGFVKHTIKIAEYEDGSFKVANIVTDADDVVVLVSYVYTRTISGNYDENLLESIVNIESLYNILSEQGEELELIYTDLEIKESGTIPILIMDYKENSDFAGGNYESRFNLGGIEVEIGTLYMLKPSDKEGLYMETITFEVYEG